MVEYFRIWKNVTYPPTRPWGTGFTWGTDDQPVPQPRQNPSVYPGVLATRANPYLNLRRLKFRKIYI